MSNNYDDREQKAKCLAKVFLSNTIGKKVKIDRIGRVGKLGIFGIPERVKIIPKTIGCAFGQDSNHEGHIQINQGGTVTFACRQCDQSQQIKHKNSQEAFLQFLWGSEAIITAINKRFVQCANGRIMDIKTHQEFKQAEWIAFHKGQLCIDEQGKWRDATRVWLESSYRGRCARIIFDPQKEPGLAHGVLNRYRGFSVKPKEDASIGPVLETLCPSYVLDCLSRLVQFPWIKQGVHLYAADIRNPIVVALEEIFGPHCTKETPKQDTILLIGGQTNSKLVACIIVLDKDDTPPRETIPPMTKPIHAESLLWFLLHRRIQEHNNSVKRLKQHVMSHFFARKRIEKK
jgi:hypothetical protein